MVQICPPVLFPCEVKPFPVEALIAEISCAPACRPDLFAERIPRNCRLTLCPEQHIIGATEAVRKNTGAAVLPPAKRNKQPVIR